MTIPQSTSFECPNCAAKYEVVRVDAPPGPTADREITCVSCGGPLHGRQGRLILKYFLVGARLGVKVAPDPISERAGQVLREALQSKVI